MKFDEWNGFQSGKWQNEIDVRNFIQANYTTFCVACQHLLTKYVKIFYIICQRVNRVCHGGAEFRPDGT